MSTISAGTTTGTALVNAGDTTGTLVFQTNGTTTALTLGTNQAATFAGAAAFAGAVTTSSSLKPVSYQETYAVLSGTTPAVNCSTGNIFSLTTSGNTTFTFTNVPTTGTGYGFTLKLTAGGTHTLTWPASVDWPGGAAPSAPASGATNVYVFITYDGGTIWYGFLGGAALA